MATVEKDEHDRQMAALRRQLEEERDAAVKGKEDELTHAHREQLKEIDEDVKRRRREAIENAVQNERALWRTSRDVCADISHYLEKLSKKAGKKDTKVAPLTPFADASDDAAQFINRLEQHFLAHDIDQGVDKVNVALSYMKGGAYYRFFSEFKGKDNWEEFKKSFEDHYLSKQVKEIQRQTLVSKKMKPNEDFDQYLNNFLKLGKSAGLDDKALAQQLSDNLPPLYQSHLVGVEKEKLDAVIEKVRIAIQAEDLRKQGHSKQVNSLQCDEDLSQLLVAGVHSLGQRVDALTEKLQVKPEKAETSVKREPRAGSHDGEQFRENMRPPRSALLCFLCQKPGHFRNECYYNPKNQWREPRYRPEYEPEYEPEYRPLYQPAQNMEYQPVNVNGAIGEQRPIQYIPVQQLN
jgi:hypothetical protein